MPTLTFDRIAEMTGGEVIAGGAVESTSVVIDSREAKPGSVFFAIRGERLDGHEFVPAALESAAGAVVSVVPNDYPAEVAIVRVPDTLSALQNLASGVRQHAPFLLIAVTGSAGKTTTKEMIATLIASERDTWKSWGNFNNQIGFPLCLANTPDGTEVVVSEMGMSSKGEIEFLAKLSRPEIGVYTNVKPVHLEFFGSIDGIAAAKRELLENLDSDGSVVLNADDAKVMEIARDFRGRTVTYGVDAEADYRATHLEERGLLGTRFRLDSDRGTREIEIVLPGRHNLENALAAIATARLAGIGWSGIERGLAEIRPAAHRGVIVDWKGVTLYDDTYNSNPYALGRALELLSGAECSGRRIAVIGDMLELGGDELEFHRESGRAIPSDVEHIVAVGPRSKAIVEGAREAGFKNGSLEHFDDAAAAIPHLREFVRPGDLVLLKASRGIGLDRIVTQLAEEA